MAGSLSGTGASDAPDVGRALAEIPTPAETLMLVEMPHKRSNFGSPERASVFGAYSPSSGDQQFQAHGTNTNNVKDPIHFDGWNYLFLGGHGKFLRPDRTIGTGTLASPNGMWTITEGD